MCQKWQNPQGKDLASIWQTQFVQLVLIVNIIMSASPANIKYVDFLHLHFGQFFLL